MKKQILIFLFFLRLFCLSAEPVSFLGKDLQKSEWIGLGFFLAPSPTGSIAHTFPSCFRDRSLFLNLSYERNTGELLTVEEAKTDVLTLKTNAGKKVWCKANKKGIFPELVFFKDFTEATERYLNKVFFAKETWMMVHSADNREICYSLPKFEQLTVYEIKLAPWSSETSIRVHVRTSSGSIGWYDINYTAVNRLGPWDGLLRYCYDKPPKEALQISDLNWSKILEHKVIRGMNENEVELSLGKPVRIKKENEFLEWHYPKSKKILFFRGKVSDIIVKEKDEF